MAKPVRSFLFGIIILFLCSVYDESIAQSSCQTGPQPLSLMDIGLKKAGNTGTVSFVVYGTGFVDGMVFTLLPPGGDSLSPTKYAILDGSRVIVTFDLNGVAQGIASVRVTNGTESATLSNALTIETGGTGGLDIKLEGQTQLTPGQPGMLYVTYANSGPVDIDIPVLILRVPGASFLGTSLDGKNLGESAFILGIPQNPVYTKLRPGISVSIPIYVKTTGTTQATLVATDPNDPVFASTMLDYSRLLDQGPQGPTPALQQQVNQLKTEYGENMADFYRREIDRLPSLVKRESGAQYQSVSHIDGQWSFTPPPATPGKERPTLSSLPYEKQVHQQSEGVRTQPPPASDGASKTYVIIVSDNDYTSLKQGQIYNNPPDPNAGGFPSLNYTNWDGERVKDLFSKTYRVPDSQIIWLSDTYEDQFTLTPETIDNAIRSIPADGDDKLVVWYSGHGMGPYEDAKYPPGTWVTNGGCYTSEQLSAAIVASGAGSTYVFNDSCFSGSFVDRLTPPNTLALAATQPDQVAREDASHGGFFTSSMVSNLAKGSELIRAYRDTDSWVQEETAGMSSNRKNWQYLSTNTASDGISKQDLEGTNLEYKFPFGTPVLQEIVNDSQETMPMPTAAASKSLLLTVSPSSIPLSYVPGGLAVCPAGNSLYVTDNTNGKVLMVNPESPDMRKVVLIEGLTMPGDIDIADKGRSMVYVSGGQVQKTFFGLTGYITDEQGMPLSGADIIFQSTDGERLFKVDANGHFTVMNVLKPRLESRTVFVTVRSQGASQLYSFDLNPACQTVAKFRFSGVPSISSPELGYETQGPGGLGSNTGPSGTGAPPSSLVPSVEPPRPEEVPVLPGKTTIVPTQVVEKPAPSTGGGANPKIIIVTPADELETGEATLVLTGWVSDTSLATGVIDINGAQQPLSMANGSFAKTISLGPGLNTIRVKATFPLLGEGQSSPVKVNVNPGFSRSTGSVTGRVLNLNSMNGASGVKVVETNSCRETTTDSEGYYRFATLPVGNAHVQVRP